jgi:hypothetical protein
LAQLIASVLELHLVFPIRQRSLIFFVHSKKNYSPPKLEYSNILVVISINTEIVNLSFFSHFKKKNNLERIKLSQELFARK